jgi:molybdate transport system permease protein
MLTQVPSGEIGALRLTLVSIAISVAALVAAEIMAERATRRSVGL